MAQGIPEFEGIVREALKPTQSEILRAKKAIAQLLADGAPHGIRTLQSCLVVADEIPLEAAHGEKLQMASADDIAAVATAATPLIARPRLALAATEALLSFVALGIAIDVAEAPEHADGDPIVRDTVTIPYQLGGHGAGVRVKPPLPQLSPAYRLAPHLVDEATLWFFDPDLFTADLEQLQLDRRARRCITEALAAFRQRLFLGSASLLGAVSEGAWYAAGEQLRHLDAQLAKALEADIIAKVMTRVSEVLRQNGALRATVDELHAQAALLRQLRNYGVHPRPDEADHLERYFSDSGAALLLMETHTYLTRLSHAVATRLEDETTTP